MSELTKTLFNLRKLRALSRSLSLEQLDEVLSKLTIVVEERQKQDRLQREELAQRQTKMAAIAKQITQDGIDVDELVRTLVKEHKPKEKRMPRPAKYRYIDSRGQERTWTGQGRTPKEIQQGLNAGQSLNDFLIQL